MITTAELFERGGSIKINLVGTDKAVVVPVFTHAELVTLSDFMRRAAEGIEAADSSLLLAAGHFAAKPEFASALEKIDDAKLATGPGQS